MQTPGRGPNGSWNRTPSFVLPPSLRALAADELTRVFLVFLLVAFMGLIILDGIVARLAPDGLPAAGIPTPVTHVFPAFQDIPSRVQTNGKPLTVTLRATGTRIERGYTPTRYIFRVTPPNEPPSTLCDTNIPTCALPLDGSRRQAGTWIVTLQVYDNTGGSAETRTRLRVT